MKTPETTEELSSAWGGEKRVEGANGHPVPEKNRGRTGKRTCKSVEGRILKRPFGQKPNEMSI